MTFAGLCEAWIYVATQLMSSCQLDALSRGLISCGRARMKFGVVMAHDTNTIKDRVSEDLCAGDSSVFFVSLQ